MYGSTSVAYTPEQFHQIFQCHGLDLVNGDNAPKGYVKVAKDKDGKTIFTYGKGDALAYPPDVLNNLLAAYN